MLESKLTLTVPGPPLRNDRGVDNPAKPGSKYIYRMLKVWIAKTDR